MARIVHDARAQGHPSGPDRTRATRVTAAGTRSRVVEALAAAESLADDVVPDVRARDLAHAIRVMLLDLAEVRRQASAAAAGGAVALDPSRAAVLRARIERALADAEDQCGCMFHDPRHALTVLEHRSVPSSAAAAANASLVAALRDADVDPGRDPLAAAHRWLEADDQAGDQAVEVPVASHPLRLALHAS